MGAKSSIEWTESTWNPVTGCTKVSPGCQHCYAERLTERFHGKGSFARVIQHDDRLGEPLRWRRPRLVFVNSMSDLFHEAVDVRFIRQVFDVMGEAERHTFQILTKRPQRMREVVSDYYGGTEPFTNVWLGVSVESQRWAEERIPVLAETQAAVRFLSCEPLLGPLRLDSFLPWVDWAIVGGESGPGARPMEAEWVLALRDQCAEREVPFFFKQWGAFDVNGRRVGKRRAGRILDGRTWDALPTSRQTGGRPAPRRQAV